VWEEVEARHIAREVNISKGTLTGVARTLESRGWLTRRPHPDDARRTLFSLTAAGQDLMHHLVPRFAAQQQSALAALSPEEVAQLATLVRKVIMHVEQTGPD
jgi:DNA-binding MarR family transcriptional regulator